MVAFVALAACMSGSDTDKYMFVLLHGFINPTCDKVKTFRPKMTIIMSSLCSGWNAFWVPLIELFVKLNCNVSSMSSILCL